MARPLAQLEQDVADAERLATLSVTQTVARRLLEEVREREAERDFLIARFLTDDRDTGLSSNAMIREALGGERVWPGEYPRDRGDLGRCERAYERAPEHLQRRMLLRLESFREAVNLAYPLESQP